MTERPSDEAVERMVALLHKQLSHTNGDYLGDDAEMQDDQEMLAEARAIAAMLPKPIDPAVLAVRSILHAHQRAMTPPDGGWGNMSYLNGDYDHLDTFKAALAAYHAGQASGGE